MSSAGLGAPKTRTANGWSRTSTARRSTCATTADCTSPRTAARWRRCSRSSWRRGRSRCSRSRWSATQWAAWSRAAPPIRRTSRTRRGSGMFGMSSRWGPPTMVLPWSRGRTELRRHSTSCPRRGCSAASCGGGGAGLAARGPRRSAGIRDLRHGSLVDEDWRGRDPEALRAVACQEVPLLPWATNCFVSATITRDPKHPLGRLLGDILVLAPSASGQSKTRRIPFREEHGHHVGGTHHIALLNHPEVYERLHDWLATAPETLAASA